MNVVCIGSGYVGSVTGAAFAALGHMTTVLDIDEHKINLLKSGLSPIYEPGLDHLISTYIGYTLFATTDYDAIRMADVVFIGVGTPSKSDGTADLKNIKLAAAGIGEHLNPDSFTVIVNKSTVPVGTADLVSSIIEERSGLLSNVHFAVISNPEFLREGYALEDVFFPDRIVIGSDNVKATHMIRTLYHNLIYRVQYDEIRKHFQFDLPTNPKIPPLFETDVKSAEMIKYAANAFLAIKISYINEIARLCESLGANVLSVAAGIGLDSRIGNKFLQVSSGWSGSCFPKDTAELLATGQKYGCDLSVVEAAIASNIQMHAHVVDKIKRKLKSLNGKTIGILGLTFKPNTDDARNTQALFIIRELISLGARVKVHDPQGMNMFKSLNAQLEVEYCEDARKTAINSDALILLTHWTEYSSLNWQEIRSSMKHPFLLDTRNFLDSRLLIRLGFEYEGIGIGTTVNVSEASQIAMIY
jgi:UDPglucose 6-dehydrogenase